AAAGRRAKTRWNSPKRFLAADTLRSETLRGPSGPAVSWLDQPFPAIILPGQFTMRHPPATIQLQRRNLIWRGWKPRPRPLRTGWRRWPSPISTRSAMTMGVTLSLALSAADTLAENLKTESRTPFLHHIPIRDVEGQIISLPPPLD